MTELYAVYFVTEFGERYPAAGRKVVAADSPREAMITAGGELAVPSPADAFVAKAVVR